MQDNNRQQPKPTFNKGRGKRTPTDWGKWLLNKMGFQRQMLSALQSKPIYQGTANAKAVAKRRAKNKVAAKQRRVNRQRAKH